MKILQEGYILPPGAPWWVGRHWQCTNCGAIFMLDEHDAARILPPEAGDAGWYYPCPTIGCSRTCVLTCP